MGKIEFFGVAYYTHSYTMLSKSATTLFYFHIDSTGHAILFLRMYRLNHIKCLEVIAVIKEKKHKTKIMEQFLA